jgi:DNA-binding GntR family transcriptional regulator
LVFSMLVDRRGLIGWEEHVDILAAIEAGDAEAAQRATRRHMSSVLNDLRATADAAPVVATAPTGR